VRWFLVAFVALAFVVPSSAASVSPKLYALSQADVPEGYFFDQDNSLLLSKAVVDRASNEEARFLRRNGFEGAYYGTYLNTSPPKWRFIHSGAFIFRAANGARAFLREAGRGAFAPFPRRGERIQLGDEAWLHVDTKTGVSTVVWRQGRVAAYVSCTQMANHRALALALARKQQRRIVALTR
jgi:hypothetical protein